MSTSSKSARSDARCVWLVYLTTLLVALVFAAGLLYERSTVQVGWWQSLLLLAGAWLLLAGAGLWGVCHYLSLRVSEQRRRANERRLEALVSAIPDQLYVLDRQGRVLFVNRREPAGQAQGADRRLVDLLPAVSPESLDAAMQQVWSDGTAVELEFSELSGEGKLAHRHAVLSPLSNGDDSDHLVMVLRDVTESKHVEERLRIAATAFETHLGMMITDASGGIIDVNATFTQITGYPRDEVLGRNPRLLNSGLQDAAFYERMWDSLKLNDRWQGEIWNRRKGGDLYPQWLTISAVRRSSGELTHYVATLHDLTERKAVEQELHNMVFFDPLTGLPNRRLLLDRLDSVLKDSYRSGKLAALILLDLDHFQAVNDTLGHRIGDQLLFTLAGRFVTILRDTDTLARLNGDEFAILLHDIHDDPEAAAIAVERVAGKLLESLNVPVTIAGQPLVVTASLGVSLFRQRDVSLEDVLKQADLALMQAKQGGRDQVCFFDPQVQARLKARAQLEIDLRQALRRHELAVAYQRQVNVQGHTVGAEALLRWQHPQRGAVLPAEFIPIAEQTRLIVELGEWVLEMACRRLVAWAKAPATAGWTVSVNVSPVQFRERHFVEQVKAVLTRTGADPSRLKLEVTESLLIHDPDEVRERMIALKTLGVRLSLDDFGTGYSSLAYLRRLPLDQIKIDQCFVRELMEDDASAAIVETIISLSSSLHLEVIAEGVETLAQQRCLVSRGCLLFQGFLFGRPEVYAEP